jgi:cytochrome c5
MIRNGDLMATVRKGSLVLALLGITALVACGHNEGAAAPPVTAASAAGGTAAGGGDAMAQAAAGGPLYGQFCAKCHGDSGQGTDQAPPVVGPNALPLDPRPTAKARKNQFHTAKDIADFVVPNMPPKGPKPTLEQYLEILAFDLKANGVDLTGKPALTPDMLSTIVIHP